MAAYGGYVAAEPLNLSGLITDFGTKALAIKEAQKEREEKQTLLKQQKAEKIAARDEERAYKEQQDVLKDIEKKAEEDNKIISKPIPFTGSKTMDDLSARVVPLVADLTASLTKEMKADPSRAPELSAKKANLTRDFQAYSEVPQVAIKGKQYLTEQAKNQSKIGQMLGGKYNSILDVGRKNVTENDDYRLVFFDTDENGKEIPNSGVPISAIANYGAYADNRVDYDKEIADLKLGEYSQITSSGGRSQIETKSAKLNPEYEAVTNSFARSKTTAPEDITRVLVELGGYGAYIDGQNNIQPQNQIDPETGNEFVKPIIKFELTENGGYYPIVTQGMQREAEALIKKRIDASMGVDVSKTRNPDVALGDGEVKEPKDIARGDVAEAKKIVSKLQSRSEAANIFKRVPGYKEKMEALARNAGYKDVQIVHDGSGLAIRGKVSKNDKVKTLQEFSNVGSLYSFMNGLDPIVGQKEFSELANEDINDYLSIVQSGKEQMLKRTKKSTAGSKATTKVGRYN